MFQEIECKTGRTIKVVRLPIKIGDKFEEFGHSPLLGEHSEEVLRELGYSDEELKEMHAAGVYNTWEDLKEKLNG